MDLGSMKSNSEHGSGGRDWMDRGRDFLPSKERQGCWKCCGDMMGGGVQHARLVTVSTSKLLSMKLLLLIRAGFLTVLIGGGVLCCWRPDSQGFDQDPAAIICLPDWSYTATSMYFFLAVVACLRRWRGPSSYPGMPPPQPTETRVARITNTATVLLFEIAIVYQTIATFLVWHRRADRSDGWALINTFALLAVLLDLSINRTHFQAKHLGLILAFGLLWVVAQIAWVHSSDSHTPCYKGFDVQGGTSAMGAAIGALVVMVTVYAYAQLCVQRDRFVADTTHSPSQQADVVEDVREGRDGGHRPGAIGSVMQGAVVNPLFAAPKKGSCRSWPSISAPSSQSKNSTNSSLSLAEAGICRGVSFEPDRRTGSGVGMGSGAVALSSAGGGRKGSHRSMSVGQLCAENGHPRRASYHDGYGFYDGPLQKKAGSWGGQGGVAGWARDHGEHLSLPGWATLP